MPVTPDQFSNFAISLIAGGGSGPSGTVLPGDTSFTITATTGQKFPATTGGPFMLLVGTPTGTYELMQCTTRSVDTLTVIRGNTLPAPDATPAYQWAVGTPIQQVATAGNMANLWNQAQSLAYNVRVYGAQGDGVTDDRAAIQAALDAATAAGGGEVYLPAGTYLLASTVLAASHETTCLLIGSGVRVRGAGRDATILKLAAAMPDQMRVILNKTCASPGGDTNITLEDFTLNGNSANQTAPNSQTGIKLGFTRGCRITRVYVHDMFGTGSSGAAEGFGITTDESTDVSLTDCTCADTAGYSASGFSSNYSSNVRYTNCDAYGMSHSMGFTVYGCRQARYENCTAYSNFYHGFNAEVCVNVNYVNCDAGLIITNQGGLTSYPFSSGQPLGNSGNGFRLRGTQRVTLTNCTAEGNTGDGVSLYYADTEGVNGQYLAIVGGSLSQNSGVGLRLDSAATGTVLVAPRPRLTSNTTAAMNVWINGAATNIYAAGQEPTPTVPPSGTLFTNPFPFPVLILVTGGTLSGSGIELNSVPIASATPASVWLSAYAGITLNYSSAPTWTWQALL